MRVRIHTRCMPLASDVDLEGLASRTDGYSGAELAALCREAALASLEESVTDLRVAKHHFDEALGVVRPRTSLATLRYFEEYEAKRRGKR